MTCNTYIPVIHLDMHHTCEPEILEIFYQEQLPIIPVVLQHSTP